MFNQPPGAAQTLNALPSCLAKAGVILLCRETYLTPLNTIATQRECLVITIKKYPNRRLYDTSKSQYINLEVIKELVMGHKEFEVVDSKSGENLTQSILLQIITEQESNEQQALLTQTVLKQLIRFYGSDMQGFMRQYLEQSIAVFLDRQDAMQNAMSGLVDTTSPLNAFSKMMESNMSWWRNFSPEPGAAFKGFAAPGRENDDTKEKTPPEEDEDKPT